MCLRIDVSETFLNFSVFQVAINDSDKKNVRGWRDTKWRAEQNTVLLHRTVCSTLNKGTLIFWSQFVLYLTLFSFPLHTHTHTILQMDNVIDFIYDRYSHFIQQDLKSKLSHNHKYIYYTFQFVISISQINNTISRGQLWAIQCALK